MRPKVKKIVSIILVLLLLFILPSSAYAAGGGEDASGDGLAPYPVSEPLAEDPSPSSTGADSSSSSGGGSSSVPGEDDAPPVDDSSSEPVSDPSSPGGEPSDPSSDPSDPSEPGDEPDEPADPEDPAAGLPGMPEDYELTPEQQEGKQILADMDVAGAFDEMVEGEDYVAETIIFLADSLEQAEQIARAYGARLEDYSYGVGTAVILPRTGRSVRDMVVASSLPDNNLPPVSPNHILRSHGQPAEVLAPAPLPPIRFPGAVQAEPFLEYPNTSQYQWHHDMIGTTGAWGVTRGGAEVRVAVLDSGIDTTHPEFAALVAEAGAQADSGVAPALLRFVADSTAYLRDVNGTKVGGLLSAQDKYGHGTHVAGIIAADAENGLGGAGVAPGVSLISIKVLGDEGWGTTDDIIKGFNKALEYGANVFNLSLGGAFFNAAFQTAINTAVAGGAVVVASAGNDGDVAKNYPAAYSGVISVSAVGENKARANFSSYGSWVDVAAPGIGINSTFLMEVDESLPDYDDYYSHRFLGTGPGDGWYYDMQGTSQASPIVAAVAALVKSVYPQMTPAQVEARLKSSVVKGASSSTGAGIVSAANAVGVAVDKPVFQVAKPARLPVGQGTAYYYYPSADAAEADGNTLLSISIPKGSYEKVYYTTDGKTPTDKSPEYTGPITLTAKSGTITLKAVTYNHDGTKKSGVTTATYKLVLPCLGLQVAAAGGVAEVTAGKTLQLKATFTGAKPTNSKVSWSLGSGKETGVSLSSAGLLTVTSAYKGGGTIQVVATPADNAARAASLSVTVKKAVTGITLSGPLVTGGGMDMAAGASTTLKAAVLPADFHNKKVTWHKENLQSENGLTEDMVTVVDGKVTVKAAAKNKSGTIDIYARSVATPEVESARITVRVQGLMVTRVDIVDRAAKRLLYTGGKDSTLALTPVVECKVGQDIQTEGYSTAVLWASSNVKVATVDAAGLVTAVGKGSATITATAADGSGKKASCTVTVQLPATEIELAGHSPVLAAGKSLTIKATVLPSNATSKTLVWRVYRVDEAGEELRDENDQPLPAPATVNGSGKLTAGADIQPGTLVRVEARWGGTSQAAVVRTSGIITLYPKAVTKIDIEQRAAKRLIYTGTLDTTVQLNPLVECVISKQAQAEGSYSTEVLWSSSNVKVATVDAAGLVTAVGKGSATITATAADGSGKKASCTVTVQLPASDITFAAHSPVLATGKSITFKTTVLPSNTTSKALTWRVYRVNEAGEELRDENDQPLPAPATVSSSGKLTAGKDVLAGDLVRVEARWGGASKAAVVRTSGIITLYPKAVTKIDIEQRAAKRLIYTGTLDTTVQLDPLVECVISKQAQAEGSYSTAVLWSSSNVKVATVDAAGLVTAVGKGSATITATAADGSGKKAGCTVTVQLPASDITFGAHSAHLATGKSITIKATVLPAGTTSKALTWRVYRVDEAGEELRDENDQPLPAPATVNSSGKLTAGAAASIQPGTLVRVEARWGGASKAAVVQRSGIIALYPHLPGSIAIAPLAEAEQGTGGNAMRRVKTSTDGKTVYLHTTDLTTDKADRGAAVDLAETVLPQANKPDICTQVVWSSSNAKVATVDSAGRVTAAGAAGSATITATAADGSGKKASVTVRVDVPTARLKVYSNYKTAYADGTASVGFGRTIQLSTLHNDKYGKPSNKSASWEITGGNCELLKKYATVGSGTGKLTLSSTLNKKMYYEFATADGMMPYVDVRATTKDGTGYTATFRVYAWYPTHYLSVFNGPSYTYKITASADGAVNGIGSRHYLPFDAFGPLSYDRYYNSSVFDYTVTSSNVGVVRLRGTTFVQIKQNGKVVSEYYAVVMEVVGNGSATITVKTNDGTGRAASAPVRVSGIKSTQVKSTSASYTPASPPGYSSLYQSRYNGWVAGPGGRLRRMPSFGETAG